MRFYRTRQNTAALSDAENDVNPAHQIGREGEQMLDRGRFTRVMTYTAIWDVIMGVVLAVWMFSSEADGEGETGKTM
jgi:hypothetical protein